MCVSCAGSIQQIHHDLNKDQPSTMICGYWQDMSQPFVNSILTWTMISVGHHNASSGPVGGLDWWILGWNHPVVDAEHDQASKEISWEEPMGGRRFYIVYGQQWSRWIVASNHKGIA